MTSSTVCKIAIVAALEREVSAMTRHCTRVEKEHQGRKFIFLEHDDLVIVCGGIGLEAARRAAEAVIALYRPSQLKSVGFAGALDTRLHVGDVFTPAVVVDARDGSRFQLEDGKGALVTFMAVAGAAQKANLAHAYGATAADMEAAAVAAAARARGIQFGVIKVISDELHFELPQMERFIDSQGQFKEAAFVLFAVLRPWLWPRVAALAVNSRKAAKMLDAHLQVFLRQTRAVEANAAQLSSKDS
jgi:adenosylhomocysteine nucleosidase